jgi:hypothetical protein
LYDTVLAVIPRSTLNQALAVFHREGFGPVVRVMDSERSPLADQLNRAGLPDARIAKARPADSVVVCVVAPERVKPAAAIAVANGATDVELALRSVTTSERVPAAMLDAAHERRLRRRGRAIPLQVTPADQPDVAD